MTPQYDRWLASRVRQRLLSRLGSPVFGGALAGVYLDSLRDGYLQLSVRNEFERSLLQSEYMPRLLKCVAIETSDPIDRVYIRVRRPSEVVALTFPSEEDSVADDEINAATEPEAPKVDPEVPREIASIVSQLARARETGALDAAVEDLLAAYDHKLGPDPSKTLRIEDIKRAVCRRFGVSRVDLISSRRTWNIVHPRQMAMYLTKELTPWSLPAIGRQFGNRDHTTVLHAVRRVAAKVVRDAVVAEQARSLISELAGARPCD
jgi:chromosomal replication initiation ATPase DnaA